jgi:hypothetical protein
MANYPCWKIMCSCLSRCTFFVRSLEHVSPYLKVIMHSLVLSTFSTVFLLISLDLPTFWQRPDPHQNQKKKKKKMSGSNGLVSPGPPTYNIPCVFFSCQERVWLVSVAFISIRHRFFFSLTHTLVCVWNVLSACTLYLSSHTHVEFVECCWAK